MFLSQKASEFIGKAKVKAATMVAGVKDMFASLVPAAIITVSAVVTLGVYGVAAVNGFFAIPLNLVGVAVGITSPIILELYLISTPIGTALYCTFLVLYITGIYCSMLASISKFSTVLTATFV